MSNPLFDRKPKSETIAAKVARQLAFKKIGIYQQQNLEKLENRRIADNFDVEAELEKARAALELSQKLNDPKNDHLFTAEAARKAFGNVDF